MADCFMGGDHEWQGVSAVLEGRGSFRTYVVEQCTRSSCGKYRINDSPEWADGQSPDEILSKRAEK